MNSASLLRDPLRASGILAPKTLSPQSHHMHQLDALRAFAVGAVMFNSFYKPIESPLGEWGVQLFFVLSGFLITGILLRCRTSLDAQANLSERKHRLRQFYIRRVLRIVPLFYAVVLLAALANIQPVRQTLLWHLTYTTNIYIALQNGWIGPLSHFWSLAVEEQFYLVWPFLILFLPARWLVPSILAAIAVAPLFRIAGAIWDFHPITLQVLLFGSLDFLGIGALLAYFQHEKPNHFRLVTRVAEYNWLGLIFLSLMMLGAIPHPLHPWIPVIGASFAPLFFAWLIHKAAVGFEGKIGLLLQNKDLIYLGQISYGLYIFHKIIPIFVTRGFDFIGLTYPSNAGAQLLILMTANILVASASWFILEKPINNLKQRFAYKA